MFKIPATLALLASAALAQGPVAVIDYSGFNPLSPIAPGSIASAYGAFGNVTLTVVPGNQLNPMPTELAGVSVRVAGRLAPLYFVSAAQINFVVPVATPSGSQPVEVLSGATVVARGTMLVWDVSPALAARTTDPSRPGTVANADGTLNLDVPIARGGIILLYATGCGATTPPQRDGVPPSEVSTIAGTIRAFVSTELATVVGAAASSFPGLCQINIRIPDVPHVTGVVPVMVEVNGIKSNFVSIRVQ